MLVVWNPLLLDPSDGVLGRFDLAALCGCHTLNVCLFVSPSPPVGATPAASIVIASEYPDVGIGRHAPFSHQQPVSLCFTRLRVGVHTRTHMVRLSCPKHPTTCDQPGPALGLEPLTMKIERIQTFGRTNAYML